MFRMFHMFHTTTWPDVEAKITPAMVSLVSPKSVWVGGRKTLRSGKHDQYHDTWAEARDFLLQRATEAMKAAGRTLSEAIDTVDAVEGMQDPTGHADGTDPYRPLLPAKG